jgi:hypothetical protein
LAREGACLIRTPSPERFALHKLVVSQLRRPRDTKVEKDLFQATVLIAVLGDRFPGALDTATRALPVSARKLLAVAATQVMPKLEAHPRAQDEFREALGGVGIT